MLCRTARIARKQSRTVNFSPLLMTTNDETGGEDVRRAEDRAAFSAGE
jgi:hypothetical protein